MSWMMFLSVHRHLKAASFPLKVGFPRLLTSSVRHLQLTKWLTREESKTHKTFIFLLSTNLVFGLWSLIETRIETRKDNRAEHVNQ